MNDTIFGKIVRGEFPCYKIYEDEQSLAFLDIYPIQTGQVVIVPKTPVAYVWELNDLDYIALMRSAKIVAQQLRKEFPGYLIGMQIEGLEIKYAHIKLFPFKTEKDFKAEPKRDHASNDEALEKMRLKLHIENSYVRA